MDQRDPGMLGPAEARLEIPEVGICAIDRKIAVFEHGAPPPGRDRTVLGHEALAKFVEIGASSLAISWSWFGGFVPAVGAWHARAAGLTSASRAITPSADKEATAILSE